MSPLCYFLLSNRRKIFSFFHLLTLFICLVTMSMVANNTASDSATTGVGGGGQQQATMSGNNTTTLQFGGDNYAFTTVQDDLAKTVKDTAKKVFKKFMEKETLQMHKMIFEIVKNVTQSLLADNPATAAAPASCIGGSGGGSYDYDGGSEHGRQPEY